MAKEPCVYILTNERHTVLYTGVTSDLPPRLGQHRSRRGSTFTRTYNATKLVYAEYFPTMHEAIQAEKKIKAGSRQKKLRLIEEKNPDWRDLSEELW